MKHKPYARGVRLGNMLDIARAQAPACALGGLPHCIAGVVDCLGGTCTKIFSGHRLGYGAVILSQATTYQLVRHVAIGTARYVKNVDCNVVADITQRSEWCTVACTIAIVCIMTPDLRCRYALDSMLGCP
ncbi:Ribosomal silencing factor RsfS [Candidatus Tremblaya princeps]|uniref:Ribosomal silencing factor RsfS n=1 Tax=Tremblaya princeps TaxID=189385 RepID=A0A143WNJ8_TREPR|nr:Ribosomal silencing factor RsfS [Candidatus Tremblaya princeps]